MTLNGRIKKEIETKKILPDTQASFRKGRGTINNIYILQHVTEKAIEKKKGKLYTFFIDQRAAFDRIVREKLWETMENAGIGIDLVNRTREIYTETRNKIKVGEEMSRAFWTEEGVRQDCPLSPTLFTNFIADIEEEWEKTCGMVVGKEKFWTLSYADDIVLLANEEKEIKEMMRRLEKYLDRKKLVLNESKSKMMVFGKGRGRKKKETWNWKDKAIERVTEFTYLGYRLKSNGKYNEHIKYVAKKANVVMRHAWGRGERIFRDDYGRRTKIFDSLVVKNLAYGAEVWRWTEKEELNRIQRRYSKWTLGLDIRTPDYIIMEETKRKKLKIRLAKKAVGYERRIERERDGGIVNESIKEKKAGKGNQERIRERRDHFTTCGFSQIGVKQL